MADAARTGTDGPDPGRYDAIGAGYAGRRSPDRRIAAQLHGLLPAGAAVRILNVGAGTGSYEPSDRAVVAVEPSATMVGQRPAGAAPCVQAVAERLPFADEAFDAATAVLTVHHWSDPAAGLAEVRRVVRGPVVVLTFDHGRHRQEWIVRDYLPGVARLDTEVPTPAQIAEHLGGGEVHVVPVPHDCTDGFLHAWDLRGWSDAAGRHVGVHLVPRHTTTALLMGRLLRSGLLRRPTRSAPRWRRPHAYLDPANRAAISGIARLPADERALGVDRLRQDLESGRWHDRNQALLALDEWDCGYRLVVSPGR